MREQNSAIKIIGVDSVNSFKATQGNPKPYALEGMGIDYDTPLLDKNAITDFALVKDEDAIAMLKRLARTFGLLVGPASGAVAQATDELAKKLTKNDCIVMLFGDSGRAYLTKNYY